jgi:hypothetical protein
MRQQLCIMLEIDGKIFFTNKKNLNYLIEFINKFKAKINYAKTTAENILTLEELAKKYCDQSYTSPSEFKIIQKNVLKNKTKRSTITSKAAKIRKEMMDFILKNKVVTFKQIQKKFEKENISTSTLCNHFTHVRHELANMGITIKKIKNGIYSI